MKNALKKVLLLSLVVLMSLGLVACGTPERGPQKLTVAIGGEPHPLDPAIASDSVSMAILQQMYYTLFEIDESGNLINEACESYEVSPDGLVYTFKLRAGNMWSDGTPVTAEHYVFGAKRSVGMGSADSYYSYFITDYVLNAKKYEGKDIADMTDIGIEVVDDSTFKITLTAPVPFYPSLMISGVFFPLRPDFAKEHESTWGNGLDVPVNGPFVPTKINSKEEYVFKPNEHFINKDKVSLEELVIKVMPDMDAQRMAFESGEIDIALSINDSVVVEYDGKPELVMTNQIINYYMLMNSADFTTAKALQDVKVRRAIQLGINREAIVTAMNAGGKYYPLYGYVPKGLAGLKDDFRSEQDATDQLVYFNQEEAKQLLADAGYKAGDIKLVYYYNTNTMHDTVAQVMQSQLAEIGIEVTLKTGELRTFFADRDENGAYELARGAMSADYMDPTTFLDMLTSWAQQKPVINDATYDGFIKAAAAEKDPAKRMEILHQAENYLVKEMAYVTPLFGYGNAYLVKKGITGVGYDPSGHTKFAYTKMP